MRAVWELMEAIDHRVWLLQAWHERAGPEQLSTLYCQEP